MIYDKIFESNVKHHDALNTMYKAMIYNFTTNMTVLLYSGLDSQRHNSFISTQLDIFFSSFEIESTIMIATEK